MKVLKPVGKDNPLTQGYKTTHKGYDHDDKPDTNYYSSIYGKVTQAKNSETKNWINNGTLTNNDYGNYIKIKGEVDGQVVYQLGAHFEQGSVLPVGTEIQRGQIVAKIGNTGNSTGSHCHTEYRDSDNKNMPVEFVNEIKETMEKLPKDSIIRDIYIFCRGKENHASQDEVDRWIQENKNIQEIGEGILGGDSKAKANWIARWGIVEQDVALIESLDNYKSAFHRLKELLKLPVSDNTEDILGKVAGLVKENEDLKGLQVPKIIYKHEGKEYERLFSFFPFLLIRRGGD